MVAGAVAIIGAFVLLWKGRSGRSNDPRVIDAEFREE